MPIIWQNQVTGVIHVLHDIENRRFTRHDQELLTLWASQVAIAIENARLFAEEQKRVEELDALRATAKDISAVLELPELLRAILERATTLLSASSGDLGLYDETKRDLHIMVSYNMGKDYTGTRMALGEGLMGRVAETCQAMILEDYMAWEGRSPQYLEGSWHACMAAPLMIGGRLVGVIGVVHTDPTRRFTNSDLKLLNLFAQQAAIAVENANLFRKVQQLATTDPLTGLYNRRHFFELAEHEFNRARRFGHALSAIMLDIDDFKRVNDTCGHAAGDQVLCTLGEYCHHSTRDFDLRTRYGGEEFAILLPATDVGGAKRVAERLRGFIAKNPIPTLRGPVAITISAGVAGITEDTKDVLSLLDRADAAMYAAKQAGRNRVEIYNQDDLSSENNSPPSLESN